MDSWLQVLAIVSFNTCLGFLLSYFSKVERQKAKDLIMQVRQDVENFRKSSKR